MVKLLSLLRCCSCSRIWGHNVCAIIRGESGRTAVLLWLMHAPSCGLGPRHYGKLHLSDYVGTTDILCSTFSFESVKFFPIIYRPPTTSPLTLKHKCQGIIDMT